MSGSRGCLGAGHAAGGRLASHSSTIWRGQPMELAPSCRAWGNVPSARHRHSVRRLTPTRSSTSGTRTPAHPPPQYRPRPASRSRRTPLSSTTLSPPGQDSNQTACVKPGEVHRSLPATTPPAPSIEVVRAQGRECVTASLVLNGSCRPRIDGRGHDRCPGGVTPYGRPRVWVGDCARGSRPCAWGSAARLDGFRHWAGGRSSAGAD